MPKCPISCGECCDQWGYIEVLWRGNHHLHRDDPCPYLGPDGCQLPRGQRPKACKDYLCARAQQVIYEENCRASLEHIDQKREEVTGAAAHDE
jgi:hypothetical protein